MHRSRMKFARRFRQFTWKRYIFSRHLCHLLMQSSLAMKRFIFISIFLQRSIRSGLTSVDIENCNWISIIRRTRYGRCSDNKIAEDAFHGKSYGTCFAFTQEFGDGTTQQDHSDGYYWIIQKTLNEIKKKKNGKKIVRETISRSLLSHQQSMEWNSWNFITSRWLNEQRRGSSSNRFSISIALDSVVATNEYVRYRKWDRPIKHRQIDD